MIKVLIKTFHINHTDFLKEFDYSRINTMIIKIFKEISNITETSIEIRSIETKKEKIYRSRTEFIGEFKWYLHILIEAEQLC